MFARGFGVDGGEGAFASGDGVEVEGGYGEGCGVGGEEVLQGAEGVAGGEGLT